MDVFCCSWHFPNAVPSTFDDIFIDDSITQYNIE